jgi:hypothetical protein
MLKIFIRKHFKFQEKLIKPYKYKKTINRLDLILLKNIVPKLVAFVHSQFLVIKFKKQMILAIKDRIYK